MALLSPRLPQKQFYTRSALAERSRRAGGRTWCSAVTVDAASPVRSVPGIRWGASKLQGRRSEMEDDVVVRPEGLGEFAYAAVFDGHAGFSSVEFLRDELYKECSSSLEGGLLLSSRNVGAIKDAILKAFRDVDAKLLLWLEETGRESDSGSTATVMFISSNFLIVSHVGDSSVVVSRCGRADVVTNPHRPYGNNKVSLGEVKRIRSHGGWISDGRICGDISVSRAFGDIRFKTKKNEMLLNGVVEGRWTQKFISRVQFKGDLVIATPDIYQVDLGSDADLIILATDGLWDYLKSTEVVAFVRNQLCQHGDAQLACEALARAAMDRGSEDNVSIVIADLGKTDWQTLPVERPNILYELSQVFATVGIVSLGIWITTLLAV